MAESHVEVYQNEASESIRLLRYGCSSILNDESFTIPTEGTKLCVRMSKSSLSSPTQSNLEFTNWLICKLKDILENCKRKNGLFNQENCGVPSIKQLYPLALKTNGQVS